MVSCAPRKMSQCSPVVSICLQSVSSRDPSDPNALAGIAAGRLHTEPTVAAAHQFECIHSDQPWDKGKNSKVNEDETGKYKKKL